MTFQDWQELYRAALLELNSEQLKPRIETAEAAIHQRLQELQTSKEAFGNEHSAIADALRGLRTLSRTECPSQSGSAGDTRAPGVAS
jgi:hypothetical protein